TEPCGLPVFGSDHLPSSITPAFSHFWISRSMRGSATRCSTNLISQLLSRLSKDPTTHYPPRGPSRACHDHSPASSARTEKTGCCRAAAVPRPVPSDRDLAQRRSCTRPQGLDRPSGSPALFIGPSET